MWFVKTVYYNILATNSVFLTDRAVMKISKSMDTIIYAATTAVILEDLSFNSY